MLEEHFNRLVCEFHKLSSENLFNSACDVIEWNLCSFKDVDGIYLQLLFRSRLSSVISSLEHEEDYSVDLDTSNVTTQSDAIDKTVFGELQVLFNPTYNIPTPHLRLWRSNGEVLSLEEVQLFIDNGLKLSEITSNDARHYNFGQLVIESHPYLDCMFCTLHVCLLEDRLAAIMKDNNSVPNELYLLNWFSIVGQYIGFEVSMVGYEAAKRKLLSKY